MAEFIYNGISSDTLGLYVSGFDTYNMGGREYESQTVPYRIDSVSNTYGRISDVQIVYHCTIFNNNGINETLAKVSALLAPTKRERLTDSWHEGTYRKGYIENGISVTAIRESSDGVHTVANLDIPFTCSARVWLDSGDSFVDVSSGDILVNPTAFSSRPILEFVGTGTASINGQEVEILHGAPQTMFVDCEKMDAFTGANVNMNKYAKLPLHDITLIPGNNKITYSGFSKVKVMPRWWRV